MKDKRKIYRGSEEWKEGKLYAGRVTQERRAQGVKEEIISELGVTREKQGVA